MVSIEQENGRVLFADGFGYYDNLGGAFTSDSQNPLGIRYVNMHPGLSATGAANGTGVGVTVTEMDPASPIVTMDDSYFINWHLPVENWRILGNQSIALAPEKYDLKTSGGALSTKPGATMVYGDRSLLKDLRVGPALEIAGTALGAGGATLAVVSGGASILGGPPGWLALAGAVTGGGGVIVSSLPDPPTEIASQSATSYDAYKAAVTQGGNYEDGTPRFSPAEATPEAMASFEDASVYLDDNFENNDKFMDKWVFMSGQVIFQIWENKWIGDAYDANGYNGNEHGREIRRGPANYKVNFVAPGWTPAPTPTPPGG
jgi:hypothetical protein